MTIYNDTLSWSDITPICELIIELDFENYLGQMYPAELKFNDTTESNTSDSDLDLLLSIESDGQPAHFPLRQTWRFQLPYH